MDKDIIHKVIFVTALDGTPVKIFPSEHDLYLWQKSETDDWEKFGDLYTVIRINL